MVEEWYLDKEKVCAIRGEPILKGYKKTKKPTVLPKTKYKGSQSVVIDAIYLKELLKILREYGKYDRIEIIVKKNKPIIFRHVLDSFEFTIAHVEYGD